MAAADSFMIVDTKRDEFVVEQIFYESWCRKMKRRSIENQRYVRLYVVVFT